MTGPQEIAAILERVRERRPRVHCLMNTVVQKFVADGLAALDAIPSMTSSREEVASFARKADALVVNLGTLDAARREAILLGLEAAREGDKPWMLDPAHCDYSAVRLDFTRELLGKGPTVLRANSAEFALLEPHATVVAVETGLVDRVALGARTVRIHNGDALMAKVTGTGCLSGGVIAAFLAVEPDAFLAAAAATAVVGVAAEIAAPAAKGPGSFEPAFLDALHGVDASAIAERLRMDHA